MGLLWVGFTATSAFAQNFYIPGGELKAALDTYIKQAGVTVMYLPASVKGIHTKGVEGDLTAENALSAILAGTGFSMRRTASGAVGVMRDESSFDEPSLHLAATPISSASGAALETVTVTSSKIGGDVQNIPISITALSQEQLTATQTAGGPDLVKQVPNLTFSKTNFTGYNIEIRGIGTQAISVTTDPAVAVAFNDIPFLRNHFFEQEFYDVSSVQVLRGPQGTLYGRNATAGVVNLVSAKPSDQFEAMASADIGNYQNRRLEAMINIPIVDDRLDLRIAGEWTKRKGYTFNEETDQSVDGRDLWSGRITLGWKPTGQIQTYLIWEHFSEDDDRVRSAKQLCKKDPGPASVDGLDLTGTDFNTVAERVWLDQGCLPTSFYSPDAFETPNGQTIPFVAAGEFLFAGNSDNGTALNEIDPYASQTQSRNLRVIQSLIKPAYKAKNDTLEFNADYAVTQALTLSSQTGYNHDFLFSTEDFNRFDTAPGLFGEGFNGGSGKVDPIVNGEYCDPQLGCSSAMVGQDLSDEHAWQFSQEVRLASSFSGPLNFSVGANDLHYQTVEDYYVFFNLISAYETRGNGAGPGIYDECNGGNGRNYTTIQPVPFVLTYNGQQVEVASNNGCGQGFGVGTYIDPNPIGSLDGQGHNYFRSDNPYRLNSFAGFGEAYYQVTPDVKLTGGLRWTDDTKHFVDIPSQVFLLGGGYPIFGVVDQEWKEWTGRFVADWTPKLSFTDQSLFYASYSRGYKGGGANPPGPAADYLSTGSEVTHPPTFAPEFINAYEVGTKDTLLDGALTLNGDMFYYDYKGYQISQIVDRTSINLNFNAKVDGAELEATWEPLPGLRFNVAGGYEDTSVDKGQSAVDLIDRTAGHTDWVVVKPFLTDTSNCIAPAAAVRQVIQAYSGLGLFGQGVDFICDIAYNTAQLAGDPLISDPGLDLGAFAAAGFNPATAPNGGAGFSKDLSGNKLPNAPPFTLSTGAQYTMPLSEDWAATARGDFYWQGNSFARIFNDKPYDQLHGYTNVNLSLTFTNQNGWQAMAYVKNVFDTTAITGAFLNSDDTALTTNIFVTDPQLFGIRLTKNW
jgi:outer membrane receptor protein involved in Fe transport